MTDRRNPVRAALVDLAMTLLCEGDANSAENVAHVLTLYEERRERKPEPRKRREKAAAGDCLNEPGNGGKPPKTYDSLAAAAEPNASLRIDPEFRRT